MSAFASKTSEVVSIRQGRVTVMTQGRHTTARYTLVVGVVAIGIATTGGQGDWRLTREGGGHMVAQKWG